jgi:hypothetical protein
MALASSQKQKSWMYGVARDRAVWKENTRNTSYVRNTLGTRRWYAWPQPRPIHTYTYKEEEEEEKEEEVVLGWGGE